MPRCLHVSSWSVSGLLVALALVACGPPPAAQNGAGDGSTAGASDTSADAVVPVPEPTATAATDAPPVDSDVRIPSRPAMATTPVEPCIARLRDDPGPPDPSKAVGAVDYHDALAAERTGKLDEARKGYLKLIQNYPQSSLVPAAYFAFGELFSADAKTDPSKVGLAEQSYLEALKYPSGPGSMRAASNFRLGLVLARSKGPQALAAFAKAAKADREASTDGCAAEVAKAATEASTEVFAQVGQPDKCWSFYLGLTGDGARTAAACLAVAEKLGAGNNGADAAKALAASIGLGAKAQADDEARAAYCKRAKAAAAQSGAAGTAALEKALAAACH